MCHQNLDKIETDTQSENTSHSCFNQVLFAEVIIVMFTIIYSLQGAPRGPALQTIANHPHPPSLTQPRPTSRV